jgi:hypothetical protein
VSSPHTVDQNHRALGSLELRLQHEGAVSVFPRDLGVAARFV